MIHKTTFFFRKSIYFFTLIMVFSCDMDQDILYINNSDSTVATVKSFEANPGKNTVRTRT